MCSVRFGRALPFTAHRGPHVCIPDEIGDVALWKHNKPQKTKNKTKTLGIHYSRKKERPSRTNSTLPGRPGSALRHREVADCPEVSDIVDARTCLQKTANIAVYVTPLITITSDLGLSIRVCMFELRDTNRVTGNSSWNGHGRRLVELTGLH